MAQGTSGHFATPAPVTGTGSRNYFRFGEWKIGPLLAAFFAAIVLLMIVGDAIAVLQLDRVETQAWRFYQADQKSLAVMHVYLDVVTFRDTLTGVAHDQNAHEFASRATALRDNFLRDVTHAQQTLSSAPDVSRDPTILIRLETVRAVLPLQVDSLSELVKVEDWQAVRFRLAGQEQVLIALSSSLVADVEQEVAQERARALESVQRTRRQLYVVLTITALLILLMAATLGWYATHRSSRPLAQRDAGAQALARGEFGYEIELSGSDELADLAKAFNHAAQQLQKFYDDVKRSEAYLQDSNAKLEEAQRITHVGYWEWDLATNRVKWSDETYRIYGMQPQECPMDLATLQEKIPPEDWERGMAVARGGSARYSIEYRVLRPTGEVRIVHTRGEVKKDASGRPYQMFGTVQDITDRKRAEDALRKSEKELRDVIDTIPAIVWSTLPDGSNVYVNRRFIEYSGMSVEQMAGSGWQALIHPDDLERHAAKWMEAVATGKPHENEVRSRRSDGQYRWQLDRGVPLRDEDGNIVKWYGVTTDIEDRKRAEEALELVSRDLQESKTRLEEAQRIAHVGHWAWDGNDGLTWSDETYRIYGLRPQERPMTVEAFQEMIHPEDREILFRAIQEARDGGFPDIEYRIIHPSGEVRIVHAVTRDISGHPYQMFGIVQDITDRKRAEEALGALSRDLQDSKAKLEEAQRITHVGYWELDLETNRVTWSDETYRIHGLQPQDRPMDLAAVREKIHPEDWDIVCRALEEALSSGARYNVECRVLRPTGEVRVVHSQGDVKRDASGRPTLTFGTIQDITDRKRAEQRLRESEAYLAEAQRLSQTGSWAWNPATGDIRYWSDMCYRVLGFDPAGPLPRFEEFFHRIHPDDQAATRERFEQAIRDTADFELDYRVVHPEKGIRDIQVVSHAVLDGSGNLDEFVGTVIDVTERKCAEQEREKLRQLEADLAHTNRVSTLGEMAASLAHEIKQPIAAAITSANSCIEWLAHEPPNLDRARAAAARIDKYGNRAAEIIDRIRSFYKKSPPQRELVDVNGIIDELLTLLKGEAIRFSVAMRTDLSLELPKLMVDRVQLQQVFMNLMLNAIEAMKDSGGELTVKSQLQDGQLQFSVSDRGVGLPMEKMDQIFSAFFTTKPQGSGMGLAISRSIVESHRGQLWASANGGGGATFHFTLPIQATES